LGLVASNVKHQIVRSWSEISNSEEWQAFLYTLENTYVNKTYGGVRFVIFASGRRLDSPLPGAIGSPVGGLPE
jgi:hypothetical protein